MTRILDKKQENLYIMCDFVSLSYINIEFEHNSCFACK